ncbi:hypothetical protein [Pseudodesulfovibrio senegalensis]|uniref:Uncharacterized protein n=1 Tax=Pseudodesulfovibrio senegalensis TaxID=1721087 RepID=A0A6N6N1F1_9BACT|nr:hypothetical protein [Pseudodesulfovibrio senegalensis]KAB1441202.1 hypothetical protein F8A88_12285 [Pseudodesulfovibrio senegalensis]
MNISITPPLSTPPIPRANVISFTIKAFKGRRNVEVHLFRSAWDPNEENSLDWDSLLGAPIEPERNDPSGSRKIVLEAFTDQERDSIINYLKDQYSTRITSIHSMSMDYPIPLGLPALSDAQEGKNIGFIDFAKIPSYPLEIPIKGLYDLSQHKPIVDG